jgi:hypothetical protein
LTGAGAVEAAFGDYGLPALALTLALTASYEAARRKRDFDKKLFSFLSLPTLLSLNTHPAFFPSAAITYPLTLRFVREAERETRSFVSGKRASRPGALKKYAFYVFYPAHLAALLAASSFFLL